MPKIRKPTSKSTPTPTPPPTSSELQMQGGARDLQPTEEIKTSPQPASQVPRFLVAKDYASVYANHSYFKVNTIWDITIDFGQVKGVLENQLVVENRLSVTMPLAVAKLLAMGIEANLQQFEKQTGTNLGLPPIAFTQVSVSPDINDLRAKESTGRE